MYGLRKINNMYVSDGNGRDLVITRNQEFRGGRQVAQYIGTPVYEKLRMKNPSDRPLPLDLGERRRVRESYVYGSKKLGMDGLNPMHIFHSTARRGPRPFDRTRAVQLNSLEYKGVLDKSRSASPKARQRAMMSMSLPNFRDMEGDVVENI